MHADIAGLRQEMVTLITELRAEMRAGFAAVDAKIAERNASLLRWMIGFWLGSLGGIITTIMALGHTATK